MNQKIKMTTSQRGISTSIRLTCLLNMDDYGGDDNHDEVCPHLAWLGFPLVHSYLGT